MFLKKRVFGQLFTKVVILISKHKNAPKTAFFGVVFISRPVWRTKTSENPLVNSHTGSKIPPNDCKPQKIVIFRESVRCLLVNNHTPKLLLLSDFRRIFVSNGGHYGRTKNHKKGANV